VLTDRPLVSAICGSGDVSPCLTSDDLVHDGFADAGPVGQHLQRYATESVPSAGLDNDGFGQLGIPASLASPDHIGIPSRPVSIATRSALPMSPGRTPITGGRTPLHLHVKHVGGVVALKEMRRANTRADITMMADKRAKGHWAVRQDPRYDVRRAGPFLKLEVSISTTSDRARPQPAGTEAWTMRGNRAVLINARPEALGCSTARQLPVARLTTALALALADDMRPCQESLMARRALNRDGRLTTHQAHSWCQAPGVRARRGHFVPIFYQFGDLL
jgi:hypothetical protein